MLDGLTYSTDEAMQRDRSRMQRLLTSQDFIEGPKAFAEKRKPNWTGK